MQCKRLLNNNDILYKIQFKVVKISDIEYYTKEIKKEILKLSIYKILSYNFNCIKLEMEKKIENKEIRFSIFTDCQNLYTFLKFLYFKENKKYIGIANTNRNVILLERIYEYNKLSTNTLLDIMYYNDSINKYNLINLSEYLTILYYIKERYHFLIRKNII